MQLIILAAGKGSRLPEKFRDNPKCLTKINSKSIIDYNTSFIKKFSKRIIITGYKAEKLRAKLKQLNFKFIINKKYRSTNMVHSLFMAKKFVNEDIVIIYGDIIFNDKVYSLLEKRENTIPVNNNWLYNWSKRMGMKKTLEDAENIVLNKNLVLEIGTKINKHKLPKYQYMGIIKITKSSFNRMFIFYKKIRNFKIDMTKFLNLCIKKNIIKLEAVRYNSYWFEIDSKSDFIFAEKEIKKW